MLSDFITSVNIVTLSVIGIAAEIFHYSNTVRLNSNVTCLVGVWSGNTEKYTPQSMCHSVLCIICQHIFELRWNKNNRWQH